MVDILKKIHALFKEKAHDRVEKKSLKPARGRGIDDVRAVIMALAEPILILDHNRVVKHANQQAIDLFSRHLVGRHIVQCIRHPHVIDAVEQVFKTHRPWVGDAKFPAPVQRHLSLHLSPISQGDGVVVLVRDITLMKRTEEMHSDFVANVSHELRSPLSAILGFIETLQGPAQDDAEARERFLGIMVEEANRMARLVDDLLSLSRVQIQEHLAPQTRIDLSQILKNTVDILTIKAEKRGVTLNLQGADDLFVLGDDDQIRQVFQNLVDNAIKYGRADSAVDIRCRAIDFMPDRKVPAIVVEVRDHGEGIENDHIARLTERFYRVDKARSRTMGGTGLGLAIVKHIITRHRGRLIIDSKVGQGSTFSVILPRA